MTYSPGPNPAPRRGRALPAQWQLAAVAVAAFLIYGVYATVADWFGLRSRPTPDVTQLTGKAAVDNVGALEAKLFAALRELAAGDDGKAELVEKLSRDFINLRARAQAELDKQEKSPESEIAKRERKQREDEAYQRVWRDFEKMLGDIGTPNAAIVDYLAKNIGTFKHDSADRAVRKIVERTKAQAGARREMAVLAKEIETLIADLPGKAAGGGDTYQARVRIRERIEAYYAARQKLGLAVERTGDREVETIDLLPFESGARVLLRNLGKTDKGRAVIAVGALRLDWRIGAASADGPLFPQLPQIKEQKFLGSPQEQQDHTLRQKKWDLQKAIDMIYRDCAEPHRQLYLGFLKQLVGQYMAMGRVVETVPVTEHYPDFLLSEPATPNERLVGAASILFWGVFTSATKAKLERLPEVLIGKECPAERLAYSGPKGGQLPRLATLGVVPKDVPTLLAERLSVEAARALDLALQHCEPRTRHVYAGHIIDFVRRAMAVKPRRRTAAVEDGAILAQLQSGRRAEMVAGLKRALLLPGTTEEMARAADAAAAGLFREQCPVSPYPTQLEAYRAAEEKGAAERAALEKKINAPGR